MQGLVIAPLASVYFDRNCSNNRPEDVGKEIHLPVDSVSFIFSKQIVGQNTPPIYGLCFVAVI